jgi:hypothetical protein
MRPNSLEEYDARFNENQSEKRKLQQNIQDLTEQLEEEEQTSSRKTQKYQLEMHQHENKIKTLE